ncbi:MAG: DUF4931 domain-containing protein [Methanosarcinaceae archaeon]|nr:DUF4931 domain-containing protein [Methanosarcinaceae archaeon]
MSEIRKHYFLDEYCIIASERGKRPSDFASKKTASVVSDCVFCGGNEDRTPLGTAVYKDGEVLVDTEGSRVIGWDVRCIPNLFPALSPKPAILSELEDSAASQWSIQEGFGYHEVIVESPTHGRMISDFSDDEMSLLMRVYKERVSHYRSQDGIRYVSLFKNWGERAGASLDHTHSQLIALPILPPSLKREQDAIHAAGGCPYCDIVDKESRSVRLLYENSGAVAFCPHFSMTPFEVWILPKQHVNHLANCTDEMLRLIGDAIRFVVSRYDVVLSSPSYNYMFYWIFDDDSYHLNVKLQPVLSTPAGFEKGTGIFINTVVPESAAEYLKI